MSNNQSDQASQQAQNIIENLRNENQNLFSLKAQKEDELHKMNEQLQAKDHQLREEQNQLHSQNEMVQNYQNEIDSLNN